MARTSRRLYAVHPSVAYGRSILDNLPAKTGRSLDEWIALLEAEAPAGEKERRAWLNAEHGIGGTTARMIAERSLGKGTEGTDDEAYLEAAAGYVEAMYGGPKEALRPVHDALVERARGLGPDVRICPCKTIVPLYRRHVFAEIKPATRIRVDLGLALEGTEEAPPERLIDTGGLAKGDRITHRIALGSVDEIDAEVDHWLGVAYRLDG